MFIDEAYHVYIAVPMYHLTEYSNNYWDTSVSLWHFKTDHVLGNADLNADNSQSFKYKQLL